MTLRPAPTCAEPRTIVLSSDSLTAARVEAERHRERLGERRFVEHPRVGFDQGSLFPSRIVQSDGEPPRRRQAEALGFDGWTWRRTIFGDHRPAFWTADRFGAQAGWAAKAHRVCLPHLIRDVQHAIEAGDTALGPGFKGLLQRARAIGRRPADLKEATLKAYRADLERRLDRLLALEPLHRAGLKLGRMIRKARSHPFVFVQNRDLEPTSNASERALQPCAVYRKITNGFRQAWGAHLHADICSVIETARRRSIHAIDAIRLTFKGEPLHPRIPAAA